MGVSLGVCVGVGMYVRVCVSACMCACVACACVRECELRGGKRKGGGRMLENIRLRIVYTLTQLGH